MRKAIHVSKQKIERNRTLVRNDPYLKVVTADAESFFGHRATWDGPTELGFFTMQNGERHVFLQTEAEVTVYDEESATEKVVS